MSIYSSEPDAPGKRPRKAKPRIWSGGRQRARFDLRAYLRVSLRHARGLASPAAASVAAAMGRFAARVTRGEIKVPASRLGRIGQSLPSHRDAGRGFDTAARMIAEAARRAAGECQQIEPLTFRGWDGAVVRPVDEPVVTVIAAPLPPPPSEPPPAPEPVPAPPVRSSTPAVAPDVPDDDRATLEAIRSMLHAAEIEPRRPARAPAQAAAPPPAPPLPRSAALPDLAPMEQQPPGALFMASATGLGYLFVALALPLGAIRTGWMALRGLDLRLVE